MKQMVRMLVGGRPSTFDTEWVAALAGLLVGTSLAFEVCEFGS